jgi:predicted transcriptional regulator
MNERRILTVGIASREEMKRRTIAIAKGERKRLQDEPHVWFSSLESLAKVLSERNMLLLDIIRRAQPQSVAALAQESGRAKSNLSRTLHSLQQIGVVEMVESSAGGRKRKAPRVKYDEVQFRYPLGNVA